MIKTYFMEHKKLCIAVLCVITIIIIACICISAIKLNTKKVEFITINSRDNLFSLTLPTTLNYTVGNANDNLSLDLFDSTNSVYIYGNTIEKSREIDLYDVINVDKNSYFSSKENVNEITPIHEFKVDNYSGYEYSMTYLDNEYGREFYCNVVWVQTQNHIFILNFEVPNENFEEFKSIFDSIKASFKLVS